MSTGHSPVSVSTPFSLKNGGIGLLDLRTLASALCVLTLLPATGIERPLVGQEFGVIEGDLSLRLGPQRRWASRYPGAGPTSARIHPVPAVVYLLGDFSVEGATAGVRDIVQRDGIFTPGALAVRTGTTVRFPNADPYVHNIFSYADPRFDLGRYPEGESREVTFDEPGIVRVYCEIHEFMRAVVLVTEHSFHDVVSEDGTFRIEGVPPGEYTLAAYHPDAGSVEERVVVPVGDTARVAVELGGPQ